MSNPLQGTRNVLVKGASVLTTVATMLSLSGFAYLAPVASAAVPSDYGLKEGNVISAAGSSDPDVYIVNDWGYKRLFLNPVIFSFYGHLGGFSAVKNVTPSVRDAFPTSGLFRNCETGDQKVWAVEVNGEDTAMLHWVNVSGDAAVSQDSNFFKKVFCINNNEANWYPKSSVAYTALNQVPVYARVPGQTPSPTGPLSASLASDNPAAGTVMETQALADLAHFNISGSGVVTTIELQRLGVSGDTTLSDVYLFVNGARVSDSGSVSSGKVTFSNGSGIFTAPATVSVRATIADTTSGQTLGVALTKVNTSVVSVSGNMMTVAADPTGSLATFTVGSATGPGDFNPQNDVNVWQSTLSISNENVWLKRLTVRELGSVDNGDIRNLRLFVDGVQVASTPNLNVDGYATFLANQKMLSGSRVLKVVADVVGGSTRTMQFSLRGYYDIDLTSDGYGVGLKSTSSFPISATSSTIGSPSITVIKATDSPSGDIVDDSSDVVLGRFTLTAFGEAVKIETLSFRASTSAVTTDSLRNGRVLINGQQYGSTTTLATTGDLTDASTSYTVNYTLQPGTPATVEVRADLHEASGDTDSVSANEIISLLMEGGDNNNGTGVSSAAQVDVPSTSIESNNQTVKSGSMTLAKYTSYANQSVVTPNSNLKLGHYVLSGGSAEDVNINTVNVGFTETGAWAVTALSNVTLVVKNQSGSVVYTAAPKATVSSTASSSYSVNFSLPKNQSYQIEVWGAVSAVTSGTMTATMDVSGTSALSASTVTSATAVIGQTLTAATGTIASAVSGATPVAKMVAANTTSAAAAFDFAATNDVFTIQKLVFDMDSGAVAAGAVANVIVKDGGVIVASAPLNAASVSFSGLNIMVPNNDTKTLTVELQYGNVGVGAASTAANAKLNLESFEARDSVGSVTSNTTERQGNNIFVHKGYPSVSAVALPATILIPGELTMAKFSIMANGSTIGIASMSWDISKATDTVLASASTTAKLFIDGTDVSSLGVFTSNGIGNGQTSGLINFAFTSEYQISGGTSRVFELKNTVSSIGTTGSLLTQFKMGNSSAIAPNTAIVVGTGTNLTWTDRSASSHAYTSADWMNDNLVKDSTAQALVK
ncbi:hypothetical protein KW791_01145 [Candidatus Parcubacteria bacterium]|nr:hypothetical protein [Candidatus Parcubacteria bacterium]